MQVVDPEEIAARNTMQLKVKQDALKVKYEEARPQQRRRSDIDATKKGTSNIILTYPNSLTIYTW